MCMLVRSVVIYSAPKIESDIIHRSITRVERAINILAHTMPPHAEGLRCQLELSQLTSSNGFRNVVAEIEKTVADVACNRGGHAEVERINARFKMIPQDPRKKGGIKEANEA